MNSIKFAIDFVSSVKEAVDNRDDFYDLSY